MKLGIAGAGKIVTEFLSIKDEIKGLDVQAIYARSNREGKLDQICNRYRIAKYYTDYDEMLKNQEIDTIYIAVLNDVHYAFCKKALEEGKHVICEKPFTVTLSQFDELSSIAQKKQLMLLEAITIPYMPYYREIQNQISKLGRVKIIECNYSQYSSRYDAFQRGEILPAFDVNHAGGALMDLNIYNIHFVTGLFGKPNSVQYYANIEKDIDVSGLLVLSYPNFQSVCIGAKDCAAPVTSNLQGDSGCIHLEQPTNSCTTFQTLLNQQPEKIYDFNENRHRMYYEFAQMTEWIDAKNYEAVQIRLEKSRIALEVLVAARKSAGIIFDGDE
ncbi:Gfo/Idh/MocA family oxidoreductase [Anaerosinus massiliensis]|uniref:Gfo/Idh/MocA family oxidoreductase n=1 Tax=Massilibacillus massiliensis TaxID=1806837 RepID=UPI000A821568|nr:Gfo/Idh/MocA family oxidoreductase [Massilibacillus massiliensis]